MTAKRVLSRYPSRGTLIGLNSWHAGILSANQDLSCHSQYLGILSWKGLAELISFAALHGHNMSGSSSDLVEPVIFQAYT